MVNVSFSNSVSFKSTTAPRDVNLYSWLILDMRKMDRGQKFLNKESIYSILRRPKNGEKMAIKIHLDRIPKMSLKIL